MDAVGVDREAVWRGWGERKTDFVFALSSKMHFARDHLFDQKKCL